MVSFISIFFFFGMIIFLVKWLSNNKPSNQKWDERYSYSPPDLKDSSWNMTNADFHYIKKIGATEITMLPVYLYQFDPETEAITTAFLTMWTGLYPEDTSFTGIKAISTASLNGYEFQRAIIKEKETLYATYRIYRGKHFAYLIGFAAPLEDSILLEKLDKFTFFDNDRFDRENLPANHLLWHSQFFNRLGLYYYNLSDFARALEPFKKAFQLALESQHVQNTSLFLENTIQTLIQLGRYEEAAETIRSNKKYIPADKASITIKEALIQFKLGNKDEARQMYKHLADQDKIQDEYDFESFIVLLIDMNEFDEAIQRCQDFLKMKNSVNIIILLASLYRKLENYDAAIALLEKNKSMMVFAKNIGYALIETYYSAGKYDDVLTLCEDLISRKIETDYILYRQATSLMNLGQYEKSRDILLKGSNKYPDNNEIKDLLIHVSGILGRGDHRSILEPIAALDCNPPEVILPETIQEDAVFLHHIKTLLYKENEQLITTESISFKILKSQAVDQFSNYTIPFDPLYESIFVNQVTISDSSGSHLSGNPDTYYIQDDLAEKATYKKILNIPLPGLMKGSGVHIIFSRKTLSKMKKIPYQHHHFLRLYPLLYGALHIQGDITNLDFRSNPYMHIIKQNEFIAEAKNVSAYTGEQRSVAFEELYPYIVISDSRNLLQELVNEYLDSIPDYKNIEDSVKQKTEEITASQESENDRINAIASWVQENIRYNAIEFGMRGQIPALPSLTLKNLYGDCKDQSILICSMLHSCNIDCYPALVHTGIQVHTDLQTMDQFNHMIVYIPSQDRWIDATLKLYDMKLKIPYRLGGKDSLILKKEDPCFKRIPDFHSSVSNIQIFKEIQLTKDTGMQVVEKCEIDGYYAGFFRESLQLIPQQHHKDYIKNSLTRSGIQVKEIQINNVENPAHPLDITLFYKDNNSVEKDQQRFLVKIPFVWEHYYFGNSEPEDRKTPYELHYPVCFKSESLIKATGLQPLTLPRNHQHNAVYNSSSFRSEIMQNNEVRMLFEFHLHPGRYAPDSIQTLNQSYEISLSPLMSHLEWKIIQ